MIVYCLQSHPNNPCYLLRLPCLSILLDCSLDLYPLLQFLPCPLVESARLNSLPTWKSSTRDGANTTANPGSNHEPDLRSCNGQPFIKEMPDVMPPDMELSKLAEVDAILISNYTCILALPFITELAGFKGNVYATDPTLQLARLLMEELVEYFERVQYDPLDTGWAQPSGPKSGSSIGINLPSSHNSTFRELCGSPMNWKQMYTRDSLDRALEKVTVIAYKERTDLFGLARVTAVSSGCCIGSCNWVIETDYEKFGYVSGSSALSTHPKAMDTTKLANMDVMILSSLTQTPYHPDSQVAQLCEAVVSTIREGGNVLIPCYPSGITYDLFGCISGSLDNKNLSNIPMYFVSPVAESSLAFANIFAEWLSDERQSKVFIPEEPFPHALLVKNGRLKHYSAIYRGLSDDFKTPCIVFAGHPSLRLGDSVHFMELWGNDPRNTVIFTEPDFAIPEVIATYQPLAMKALFCPVDTSLDIGQANKLLSDLQPRRLLTAERYARPFAYYNNQGGRSDLLLSYDAPDGVHRLKRGEIATLPLNMDWEKMKIDPELSAKINLNQYSNGISACHLSGILSAHDNKLVLRPFPKPISATGISKTSGQDESAGNNADLENPTPCGACDVDMLMKGLTKAGLEPVMDRADSTTKISLMNDSSVKLEITPFGTELFCNEGAEKTRRKVTDVLVTCFQRI